MKCIGMLWEALEEGVKLGRAWDALTWGLARKWRPMAGVGKSMVLAWIDLGQRLGQAGTGLDRGWGRGVAWNGTPHILEYAPGKKAFTQRSLYRHVKNAQP